MGEFPTTKIFDRNQEEVFLGRANIWVLFSTNWPQITFSVLVFAISQVIQLDGSSNVCACVDELLLIAGVNWALKKFAAYQSRKSLP